MNRFKKKLNNERGASITWALLIFLVCTVVGSAVLVAGTAAAGRMSKLAENDQRYYAVTSTAGLLRDVLKEPITVTRTKSRDSCTFSYSPDDKLKETIVSTMMGWPAPSDEGQDPDYFQKDAIPFDSVQTLPLSISCSGTGAGSAVAALFTGVEKLAVDLSLNPDGSLLATVSKDGYSIRLSFELARTFQSDDDRKTDQFSWNLVESLKTDVPAGASATP